MSSRRHLLLVVPLALAVLATASSALGVSGSDTITTIAGSGVAGFSGDGGQATSAQLHAPVGVAVDAHGNVYIADAGNHRVREVSDGIITTVAGTGTGGDSGDGGQATSAQLGNPTGVAVDPQGNLYIADSVDQRIRKVSNGVITTIAGTGTAGYSGDGGQATSAQLSYPFAVAVDDHGDVYIADTSNERVRKVSNGVITTIAGTGTAGYSGDGGQATSAQFNAPYAVAVDAEGDAFIADVGNAAIREVSGGIIRTVAGNGTIGSSGDGGPATAAELKSPTGLAVDDGGSLYIADFTDSRVRKVSGGIITTLAGTGTAGFSGDGGPASSGQLVAPASVAVGPDGSLFVTDYLDGRVREIANEPPSASFSAAPSSGHAPLTVGFDASASTDPDGSITSYAWTFGDGASGSGKTTSHTYASAGSFTATLTVTDDSGATVSRSHTITASAPPPPKPDLTASKATLGNARSGKTFTVTITVENARTGRGVRGRVSCTARLARTPLAPSSHSSAANGKASCSWRLPRTAHGKKLTGSITDTYEGISVSRPFSVEVD